MLEKQQVTFQTTGKNTSVHLRNVYMYTARGEAATTSSAFGIHFQNQPHFSIVYNVSDHRNDAKYFQK